MLFALERDPAGGEQDAEEHQRDRDGDHDGEAVQRRAAAVHELGVDRDRLPDAREHALADPEVGRGEVGEARDAFERFAVVTGRGAGDHPAQFTGDLLEPDQVRGRAERAEAAAPDQRVDRLRGGVLDLLGEAEVRFGERRAQLRAHQRLLERIAVVEHFDLSLRGRRSRHGPRCPTGSPPRRAPCRPRPAASPRARELTATGSTLLKSWWAYSSDGDPVPADLDGLARRRFIDDRDARTRGRARDREADQQRDHDRIEDEHRDEQPRAREDQRGPCAAAPSRRGPALALEERRPARARGRSRPRPPGRAARRSCPRSAAARRPGRAAGRRGAAPRPGCGSRRSPPFPPPSAPSRTSTAARAGRGRAMPRARRAPARAGRRAGRRRRSRAGGCRRRAARAARRPARRRPVCSSIAATVAAWVGARAPGARTARGSPRP